MSVQLDERPWLAHYDAGVPYQVDVPDMPLGGLLTRAAREHPKQVALRFYSCDITYRDLLAHVEAFAAGLQALGTQAGNRVLIALPNTPHAVIAFYGTLRAGATAVLCNPLSDDTLYQLLDSGADTVVTTRGFLGVVLEARRMNVDVGRRLILGRMRDYLPRLGSTLLALFSPRQAVSLEQIPRDAVWMRDLLAKHRGQQPAPADIDVRDVAVLAYTGGTTGQPRAAMLTHRSLLANTLQVRSLYTAARESQEIMLCALPFSHAYGLTAGLNVGISMAATLVLLPHFRPGETLRTIESCRPTLFPGVPAMYNALVHHPRVKRHDLSSLYACISGATSLPIEVKEAFERLTKGRLVEGYGLTEASPVTHANPFDGERRSGSIGVPVPGTMARVVDLATGLPVRCGEIGELQVSGPQLMKGYWGGDENPVVGATRLAEGWLQTGDLALMDEAGFFRIIGRRADVIDWGEHSIYPRDIEEVLYEHPKVREAAVVGQDGGVHGGLCAHIVLRAGETADEHDIIEFCKRRLSPHKVPQSVRFQKRLPRSAVGKLLRRML